MNKFKTNIVCSLIHS